MKKLFPLLLLFSTKAIAQMPQADMNITGVVQPLYLSMDGIKNNKVTYIRETAYSVDTTTHQANMNKIEKITVYNMAYAGNTALLVKLIAAMGTDTNKLVRNEDYGYDATTGLLKAYQTASNEGIQMGAAGQIIRDANGIITGKSVGVTFDLSKPFKPTDYMVSCSGGAVTNPGSVSLKYNKNGKEVMDRIHMEYDTDGRLVKTIFYNFDGTNTDKNDITYDSKGRLKEVKWDFGHKGPEYRIDDGEEGYLSGVYVAGATATGKTIWVNRIGITSYEYDAQGKISTVSFTKDDKLDSKEMYTYTATGLPETVKIYNGKGQLTGLKKITCQ